ncbi:hypothetical protein KUCAC02_036537, partial [Chaenocephalus aceratus]
EGFLLATLTEVAFGWIYTPTSAALEKRERSIRIDLSADGFEDFDKRTTLRHRRKDASFDLCPFSGEGTGNGGKSFSSLLVSYYGWKTSSRINTNPESHGTLSVSPLSPQINDAFDHMRDGRSLQWVSTE